MIRLSTKDRHNRSTSRTVVIIITACLLVSFSMVGPRDVMAADIEKWGQHRTVIANTTWSDNPFDLALEATFNHIDSGRALRQFGFYAGNDTWKIYFMPDAVGAWEYVTYSPDPDLDGQTGTFEVVASSRSGSLRPAGLRWKYADGPYTQPILIPSRQYIKSNSIETLRSFLDWSEQVVRANVLGTTLVYFGHGQEAEPYEEGFEGERFYLPVWDRLNAVYDDLSRRGMGHYIMFYSDDAESPSNHGIPEGAGGTISPAEERLFKYAIARFGAYPTVIWDTGIDISETRSSAWQENFAKWFAANDPWQHPVGNRSGGGSGGIQPAAATYYSDGEVSLPDAATFVDTWQGRSVPTIFTDRWRENYSRGSFDTHMIRNAVWQMALIGGTGLYISGDDNGGYLTSTYASDFESAEAVGFAVDFFGRRIADIGMLDPRNDLLTDGSAVVAASSGDLVAYLPGGGSVTLKLSGFAESLLAYWYNPRTGVLGDGTSVLADATLVRVAPDSGDWVLWITTGAVDGKTPMPPEDLKTN